MTGVLDVPHLLGLLQDDPDNADAVESLKSALSNGERSEKAPHLVNAAREAHERRGEYWVAAQLLELEATFATGDPDREAALWKELGRLHREELLDDDASKAAYEKAAALRPGDDEIAEAIEAIDASAQRWKEIAKRFVDEAVYASDGSLKNSLLVSAT